MENENEIPEYLMITPKQEEFIHKFAARWRARAEEKRKAEEVKRTEGEIPC